MIIYVTDRMLSSPVSPQALMTSRPPYASNWLQSRFVIADKFEKYNFCLVNNVKIAGGGHLKSF